MIYREAGEYKVSYKEDQATFPIKFDKITERIESLCFGLDMDFIDPILISQKVIEGIFDGITTQRLDQLAAETAAYLGPQHPDYALLAGRIAVSNLHKETTPSFFETLKKFYIYLPLSISA